MSHSSHSSTGKPVNKKKKKRRRRSTDNKAEEEKEDEEEEAGIKYSIKREEWGIDALSDGRGMEH